ncbi:MULTISPECIES: ABC transporter ATP-binding protein [Catenuloplanes]|uniref:ABC-type multidrug transport system fused ATPase/permease subunit n=1 Tax=Catenuloplanes niger TaxID=587534 RepID=A0AAE4CPA0_9ACTN|nr:ABC transporter ATP-binding protein [Catenuloplanes niger]MDR7320411.1 ABC-type multidrug transport system fused ATPase/permease subunit [Catenuloplanes niger]
MRADLARWRDVRRLTVGHRRAIAVAATLSLAGSALALAQPILARDAVDTAAAGTVPWPVLGALVLLFTAQAGTMALARYVQARTGETMMLRLRRALIDHLLRVRIRDLDRHRVGDLIARAGGDTAVVRTLIAQSLGSGIAGVAGLAGTVALLAWLDPWLLIAVSVMFAIAVAALLAIVRRLRTASRGAQEAEGALVADLERALGAIRTVRAGRAEACESARAAGVARRVRDANVRMARLAAVSGPANDLAVSGAFLVVLLIGATRVAAGQTSLGQLVAFTLAMTYLAAPIGEIFLAVTAIQQGSGALHRINEVLALPRETDPVPARPHTPAGPVLELRDVWFGYHPDRPVLRGVDLVVPARGHLALVGPSGAGKSTIFALVERFYDPDRGTVLLHGQSVASVPYGRLRATVGLVEQDCPLLHGTLRDNLLYGSGPVGDDELHRMLALTSLTGVVAALPRGLDTDVGEHGRLLSGGQRQRVAIARCLLSRPRLILLDEPTAHLDPDSERALADTIRDVSRVCALIVIAHRFSTVRGADRVVVLDGGRVVADGTHAELLRRDAYYRRLAASAEPLRVSR